MAAKRPGGGGPSPGGGHSPQPGRKASGLRLDGVVLAWELGKSCGFFFHKRYVVHIGLHVRSSIVPKLG